MARKIKTIFKEGVDVREVGYYSTPSYIADFLTEIMLEINPIGSKVLDPAVGKEELLHSFYRNGKEITSYDIIDYPKKGLSKFNHKNFLESYMDFQDDNLLKGVGYADYDYYICNPPYNCHEIDYIRSNKKRLKYYFPIGAHNMYSLFLSAMINIAKPGALIGVIVADSFLTLNNHSLLRKQILNECSIHSLLLCPPNLFWSSSADVRTCLLVLQKGKRHQGKVDILNRGNSLEEFQEVLTKRKFQKIDLNRILLTTGQSAPQFVIGVNNCILDLFHNCKKLSDKFKCVTCISTGNDLLYLSKKEKKGYSVPFYKNPASSKFIGSPDAYLVDNYQEISRKDKNFMLRNRQFVGLEGIACSSMGLPFSAIHLPEGAVTGVNPTIFPSKKDLFWLLSYLNSSLVTYLVRGVLNRTNMVTSGYINALPVPDFNSKEKEELSNIALSVLTLSKSVSDAIREIDQCLFRVLNISESTYSQVQSFSRNLGVSV